eukprot:jgi/Tetstr1/443907/TSEL_031859.t1
MPPGLEPPCSLTFVEITIVGFVRHSRYMATVEDRSGQNRPAAMRHKVSKNDFAVFPVAHPAVVHGRTRALMPNSTFGELLRTPFAVVFITAKDVPQALKQLRHVPELKVPGERITPYLGYFCDHREEHQRRSGWEWEPYHEVMDEVVQRFAHVESVPEELVQAAVLHTGDEGRELLECADETTHVEYHRSASAYTVEAFLDLVTKAFSPTPEIDELSFSLDFSDEWFRPHFQDHIQDVSKPHKIEISRDDAAAFGGSLRTALWSNTPISEHVQILKNASIGTPEIRAGQPRLYALCDKKKPDALKVQRYLDGFKKVRSYITDLAVQWHVSPVERES